MAIERGICGFENGTRSEFGSYANVTLSSVLGTGARSGSYRLHKSSNAASFTLDQFPAGSVIGTTGTVTTGNHKRATVRAYFRLTSADWVVNTGGQQLLVGFGGEGGTCQVWIGRQNTSGGFIQIGRRIGLRIGAQSHNQGAVGAYPWDTTDLTFDVWYCATLEIDLDVSSNTVLSASVTITDDDPTSPTTICTLSNSASIGATDALGQLSIGPGSLTGAFGMQGAWDIDDIVYIGTSDSDAASAPVLPTKNKIIPVLATSFISNQWETGTFSNIDEVPVSTSGSVGDSVSSVLGTGTKMEVELQDSDILDVGNIIGIKVFTALAVASGSGSIDVDYNGSTKTITAPSPSFGTGTSCIGYQDWALPQLMTEAQFSASHVDVTKRNGTQQSYVGSVSAEVLWDDLGPATPSSCTPNEGPTAGGTVVTVNGSGFTTRTRILFGSRAAVVTSVKHAQIVCTTPRNASGYVDVMAGENLLTNGFTYIGAVPGRISLGVARRDPEVSISNAKGNGASTFNFSLNGEDAGDYQSGGSVKIDLNGEDVLARGVILTTELTVEDSRFNDRVDATGSDDVWIMNSKLVVGTYSSVAADTIIRDIMSKYAPDFSTVGVQSGLPSISVAFFRDVNVGGALDKITAMISAHWYLEAGDDVDTLHVYTGSAETGVDQPDDIDDDNLDLSLSPAIKVKTDSSQIRNRVYVRGKGISTSTTARPPVGMPQGDPGGSAPVLWFPGGVWGSLLETGGNIDSDRNRAPYNWFAEYVFVWTTTLGDSLGEMAVRWPTAQPVTNPSYTTGSNQVQCSQNLDDRITGLKIYRQVQYDGPHGDNGPTFGNADLTADFSENGHGPYFLITTIAKAAWPGGGSGGTPILYLDITDEDTLVTGEMKKYSELIGQDNTANIFAMREDLDAQAYLRDLLGVGDGVREYLITDPSIASQGAAVKRADAELALFAMPIITVTYATRDLKSKVGRTVHIDLTEPAISGDFKIQSVQLQQIHVNDELIPMYVVTASSVRFDLEDLIQRVVLNDNNTGGSASLSNQGSDGTTGGGHADSADKLFTPRLINDVSFNGTANINITAAPDHLGETPTGSVNGSNTVFTTAAIYKTLSLTVYVNGIRQKKTTHWSETTSTTFTMNQAPLTGDLVTVDYEEK